MGSRCKIERLTLYSGHPFFWAPPHITTQHYPNPLFCYLITNTICNKKATAILHVIMCHNISYCCCKLTLCPKKINILYLYLCLIDWLILSIKCVPMDRWPSVREGFYCMINCRYYESKINKSLTDGSITLMKMRSKVTIDMIDWYHRYRSITDCAQLWIRGMKSGLSSSSCALFSPTIRRPLSSSTFNNWQTVYRLF